MKRKEELNEAARILFDLQQKYNFIVISDNGCTDALIVDNQEGCGYHFNVADGTLENFD